MYGYNSYIYQDIARDLWEVGSVEKQSRNLGQREKNKTIMGSPGVNL